MTSNLSDVLHYIINQASWFTEDAKAEAHAAVKEVEHLWTETRTRAPSVEPADSSTAPISTSSAATSPSLNANSDSASPPTPSGPVTPTPDQPTTSDSSAEDSSEVTAEEPATQTDAEASATEVTPSDADAPGSDQADLAPPAETTGEGAVSGSYTSAPPPALSTGGVSPHPVGNQIG